MTRAPKKTPPPDPFALAQFFLAARYTENPQSQIARALWLRYYREEWWRYGDGCFQRLGIDEVKADIAGFMHEQGVRVSAQLICNVMICLTNLCFVDPTQAVPGWLDNINGAEIITALNGNVSLTDRDKNGRPILIPHSALYFGTTRLPYDYNPDATCPLWLTFLHQVMSGDEEYIRLLQQWHGYLLRRDLNEQKFLLCVGEGSNGKGVLFALSEALVGSANVCHVPLARFENPFALYSTLGKRLNLTNEAIGVVEEFAESQLKSFVAGDSMSFERKFLNPVDAKPTARLMIATNVLPRFTDRTWGLWRRVLLVPFDVVIPENRQLKGLANELREELPGVLNWAIQGLDDLNRNRGFSVPAANVKLLEEYRRDADPARAFLLDGFEPSENGEHVVAHDLYAAYAAWCRESGCQPMNERHMGQHVRRLFPKTERRRVGPRDDRAYVYTHLRTIGVPCVPSNSYFQRTENEKVKNV